jgi:hypothetical protein
VEQRTLNLEQFHEPINPHRTHLPVLCIYSEDDRYRTPESMRAAFAKSKNQYGKIVAYKGNLHGTPLFAHDRNLENEIVK